jgi:hypothetical protein
VPNKPQASRRRDFRSKRKPFNAARVIKSLEYGLVEDEVGANAICRFVDPKHHEIFQTMGEIASQRTGITFNPLPSEQIGQSLLRTSEIEKIRRPFGNKLFTSKLGGYSTAIAKEIIFDMLPESGDETTEVMLGRFILARPNRRKRHLLATISQAGTTAAERSSLEIGIDNYEGASHDWPDYLPHITLGHFETREVRGPVLSLPRRLDRIFKGHVVTLQPAQ